MGIFDDHSLTDITSSSKYRHGYYDDFNQIQFVLPNEEWTEDIERNVIVIGHPGVDGIDFVYRFGLNGIWTYYSIENRYEYLASNIDELVSLWINEKIFL
jgi:hypothetical protein